MKPISCLPLLSHDSDNQFSSNPRNLLQKYDCRKKAGGLKIRVSDGPCMCVPIFPNITGTCIPSRFNLKFKLPAQSRRLHPAPPIVPNTPCAMRNRDPSCRKGVTLSIVLVDPLLIGLHSFHMQLLGYTMLTYRYVRENCRDNEKSRMDSDGGLSLLN